MKKQLVYLQSILMVDTGLYMSDITIMNFAKFLYFVTDPCMEGVGLWFNDRN